MINKIDEERTKERLNWKRKAILYEEYISYEFGKTSEDFIKWLKLTHPDEVWTSKYEVKQNDNN